MKKFLLTLLICLIPVNSHALSKINGNQIVLLTAKERQDLKNYEDITYERAINLCKLLGKDLVTYSYKETDCETNCKKEYPKIAVPTSKGLMTPSYDDIEVHYHDGGAAVAMLSLGFIPIIIQYKTRIVTDIQCGKKIDYILE